MFKGQLFSALGIKNEKDLFNISKKTAIRIRKLKYYNQQGLLPSPKDLRNILSVSGMSEIELKLKIGIIDHEILDILKNRSSEIIRIIDENENKDEEIIIKRQDHKVVFTTEFGQLYQGDCLSLLETMEEESVDLIFADPPFNLNKIYGPNINDNVTEKEYKIWTEKWVLKCINLLKEGGSFFVWNLPKWNTYTAQILNQYLTFRNWIAVDIKYGFPIKNRLYPSHYSLLYFVKGEKNKAFNEQRLPLEICRLCGGDIRDYGGYKGKLNINGINLTDVWVDIPPVRHSKNKTRESNELSLKLLERIISLASNEGDTVLDPFGGSGTTYVVAELLKRNWIGIEIGSTEAIQKRFNDIETQKIALDDIKLNKNTLFTKEMIKIRRRKGHWLPKVDGENNKDTIS